MRISYSIFLILSILLCFYASVCMSSEDGDGQEDSNNENKPERKTERLCDHPPLHGISVMDDFPTPDHFYDWFVLPGQPVLFKSVLEKMDYPAYHKWTNDYLRERYGASIISAESGKKETRKAEGVREQTFSEFLDSYHEKDIYMVQDVKEKMKDEIVIPKCLLCGGMQDRLERHLIWFSSGGTRSVLHLDNYNNINCLFNGRKDIIFIDKKHNGRVEAESFAVDKGYSRVDVDNVDYDKFPQLKNIPWINATMEKGDCLFIPRNWYHQVNSAGNRNLAVNLWWLHVPWFNTTDCDLAGDVPRPTTLSSYPRALHHERVRLYLFDPFVESSEVTQKDFFNAYFSNETKDKKHDKETERIRNRLEKMFEMVDSDNNTMLTWKEIMTFNISSLLTKYGDMLPFDPNDLLIETIQLYEKVQEELTPSPDPVMADVSHDEF